MKKYLIYSDVHFSTYSSILRSRGQKYSTRLHNLIDSVSWAEHLADEQDCDAVINLGDFFDRPDIESEVITALQDVYFCNKPHIIVTGNHDANISNLEFSSVQLFKSLGAKVITDVEKEEINEFVDFYYIPYLVNEKLRPLKDIVSGNKKKVIFSHNDIAGIQYGKFTSQNGFHVKDIVDNCNLFLNGHLHNGCIIEDKIVLVGNLTGANFNEDANRFKHYAYILTIEDSVITLEPYLNPYAINFYKLSVNSERDLDKLKLTSKSVISVVCNNNLLNRVNELINNNRNILEHRLIASYNSSTSEEEVDFKVENHLQQFIDFIQTKIEPSEVLSEELAILSKE